MSLLQVFFYVFLPLAAKFLSALAADGTITDVDAITNAGLDDTFNPLKELVKDSLAKQEKALAAVQVVITQIVIQTSKLMPLCACLYFLLVVLLSYF